MSKTTAKFRFEAKLLKPANLGASESWLFLILPKAVSDGLPRRGRTTVEGTINGLCFQSTLEPDGKLSHWLRLEDEWCEALEVKPGDLATVEISPLKPEPEPTLPIDLLEALDACPEAKQVWESTTTIARVDWIHWVQSAKQAKTRARRVNNACEMLASGKRRVCCFDQSGFYSKSLSAPKVAD